MFILFKFVCCYNRVNEHIQLFMVTAKECNLYTLVKKKVFAFKYSFFAIFDRGIPYLCVCVCVCLE